MVLDLRAIKIPTIWNKTVQSGFVRGLAFLGSVLLSLTAARAFCESGLPIKVKYLPPSSLSPDRQNYEAQVIRAALDVTVTNYGPYEFSTWDGEDMNLVRGVREISRGEVVNIATNPLSSELIDEGIEVITIPLMKGLLGYRALVVRRADLERIGNIHQFDDFRKLKVGQLHYWSDIAVYEANDFEVVKGASIEVLFSMLDRERFDYLPLGVGEIDKIFATQKEHFPDLAILPGTYLYYPFPVYTYVCRCEPKLAERIRAGLKKIQNNGELERIFSTRFGAAMKKIHSPDSQIFKMENSLIPNNLQPQSATDTFYIDDKFALVH